MLNIVEKHYFLMNLVENVKNCLNQAFLDLNIFLLKLCAENLKSDNYVLNFVENQEFMREWTFYAIIGHF